nr:serine/threonine-protein kinase [Acaryochloris sp. IP29b_bin.148]
MPLSSLLRKRYKVTKLLGRGGFGKTYLAYDTDKLNERCVVKQLAYYSTNVWQKQKAMQLFKGEAQQLQQLGTHPQIPALLGYFEEKGCLFLVQQFIEGKNLAQFLDDEGPLSEKQVWQVLLSILPVLQFIHKRGVVHRDIKPDNIMHLSGSEQYILIDFGVAKSIPEIRMDHSGTVLGSPGYAPFEQMHQGVATPSGDLFGLGASCFHLLSQTSPAALSTEHGYSWLVSWQDYVSQSLSPSLQRVLNRLLQKESALRYQSATLALADIRKSLPRQFQTARTTDLSSPQTSTVSDPVQLHTLLTTTLVKSSFCRPIRLAFFPALKLRSASFRHWKRPRMNGSLRVRIFLVLVLLGGVGYALNLLFTPTSVPSQPTLTSSSHSVEVHIAQGGQAFKQGNYHQALRDYKAALQLDPNNEMAHFYSGITKRRLKDLKGAMAHYTTALRLNPDFADAYNNRGLVKRQLGDELAAIADFTAAIRVNPQHAQAYNNRGTTYSEQGEKNTAIADYTQAIKLNSQSSEAYFNRGIVQSDLGNLKAAIADYTTALRLNPNYAQTYNNRGIVQSDLGNLKAAIADYTAALRLNPNYAQAYNNRGIAQSDLGNLKAAIADYTAALRLNSQYSQAYNNRGMAKSQLGDKQGAIKDLQKAAEIYQQQQNKAYLKVADKIKALQ